MTEKSNIFTSWQNARSFF